MERIGLSSFLKAGHVVHLYTYDFTDGVPPGVHVRDANEIIPFEKVFKIRGGYSSFSDFFRWKLILDRGGWWVDTDSVCLRPFDFTADFVFTGGHGAPGTDSCVSSGLFKAPKGCEFLKRGWQRCQEMNPDTMSWGEAGPPLITEAVHRFGLQSCIIPGRQFFPIFYTYAPQAFIESFGSINFKPDVYSVHLFNEMWRASGLDKWATYPESSIYEQLKRKFCETSNSDHDL